jgi:ribokinase
MSGAFSQPDGPAAGAGPRVTVLGSLNMDISVTVSRLPEPGATVLGGAARFTPGGKGANQAVAAARLGGVVRMTGCTGADDFGARLRAALAEDGIDTSGLTVLDDIPTGLAMITIDAAGENTITVAPGANHRVADGQVRAALASAPDVLVISAEIPLPAIKTAITGAGQDVIRLVNLAPAPPRAEAMDLLADIDWLVVNQTEAAAILGRHVSAVRGLAAARDAAQALVAAGAHNAVVTAGPDGAGLAERDGAAVTVAGFRAEAVDTVGAGDTFTGAFAVALGAGVPAGQAAQAAAAAAATAVTRHGAQAGMPAPGDIEALLGYEWPIRLCGK